MTDAQAMLMHQEGTGPFRDGKYFPYHDSEGIWTIGVGHNLEAKGIPADMGNLLFQADLAEALDDIRYNFSCYDTMSRPRQLVLISLAFNLGRTRLARFVRFIAACHLSKWDEAADEILDSDAARNPALMARYKTLAMMMRTNTSAW